MNTEPTVPPHKHQSFWTTLPGILAQVAAVIVAITGFIVAISQCRDGKIDGPPPTPFPTFTPTPSPCTGGEKTPSLHMLHFRPDADGDYIISAHAIAKGGHDNPHIEIEFTLNGQRVPGDKTGTHWDNNDFSFDDTATVSLTKDTCYTVGARLILTNANPTQITIGIKKVFE